MAESKTTKIDYQQQFEIKPPQPSSQRFQTSQPRSKPSRKNPQPSLQEKRTLKMRSKRKKKLNPYYFNFLAHSPDIFGQLDDFRHRAKLRSINAPSENALNLLPNNSVPPLAYKNGNTLPQRPFSATNYRDLPFAFVNPWGLPISPTPSIDSDASGDSEILRSLV